MAGLESDRHATILSTCTRVSLRFDKLLTVHGIYIKSKISVRYVQTILPLSKRSGPKNATEQSASFERYGESSAQLSTAEILTRADKGKKETGIFLSRGFLRNTRPIPTILPAETEERRNLA